MKIKIILIHSHLFLNQLFANCTEIILQINSQILAISYGCLERSGFVSSYSTSFHFFEAVKEFSFSRKEKEKLCCREILT